MGRKKKEMAEAEERMHELEEELRQMAASEKKAQAKAAAAQHRADEERKEKERVLEQVRAREARTAQAQKERETAREAERERVLEEQLLFQQFGAYDKPGGPDGHQNATEGPDEGPRQAGKKGPPQAAWTPPGLGTPFNTGPFGPHDTSRQHQGFVESSRAQCSRPRQAPVGPSGKPFSWGS